MESVRDKVPLIDSFRSTAELLSTIIITVAVYFVTT